MRYAFILGRVYSLSIAEILDVFKRRQLEFSILGAGKEVLIVETNAQFDAAQLQKDLGGTVKIVKIVDFIKKREQDSINFALRHYFKPSILKKDYFKEYSGKKQFGISVYLLDDKIEAFGEPKRLGMFIKKSLQDQGVSLRVVLPTYNTLSLASVAVTKNLLLEKGAEIDVLAGALGVFVGKTLTVQDFEDYGRRDYQRPVRDEKQGMVPPKVAQIMLNFSGVQSNKGHQILDPFCGIGTILQEGMLLGYKMVGSDINKKAIEGSEKNLEWFRNRYKIAANRYKLEVSDVADISKLFKGEKIASVVTEGFLGPMYGELPKPDEIAQNFVDLETLWTTAFKEFKKVLPEGARVVICLPAYKHGQDKYIQFPSVDFITDLGYSIEDHFEGTVKKLAPFLKVTDRKSMIYDRKDQIVAREILTFINK